MSEININGMNIYQYYFPTCLHQIENLLGKMLTHVEAMNLPEGVEKANKDLVRQTVWSWWNQVQENSLTSAGGCIGPIFAETSVGAATLNEGGTHKWISDVGELLPIKEANEWNKKQEPSIEVKGNKTSIKNVNMTK